MMKRREFVGSVAASASSTASSSAAASSYQVGAYYFGNYHVDPRNEKAHGPGWTEWELVKRAQPRFPGHQQPKRPLWGYEDEADPKVMEKKIDAAARHGLSHFIFDFYWYDDGPFLDRPLDNGFLKASNNRQLQFCLMWANHDWVDIQPAKLGPKPPLQYPGAVTRATWETMTDHIVRQYFAHPSHWKIDGRPYFSIYELFRFVESMGGVAGAREALDSFRRKTRAAGHPGVHLNAVVWGVKILPSEKTIQNPRQMLEALGFDSVTSYVWVHHVRLDQFPVTPYRRAAGQFKTYRDQAAGTLGLPYHPNVTMGWDSSPRTCQSDMFVDRGYPFTAVMGGNTPAAFREALADVKAFLDSRPGQPRICNINAWNEWTEGSYLEPDTVNGMGYLEAIRSVFGSRK